MPGSLADQATRRDQPRDALGSCRKSRAIHYSEGEQMATEKPSKPFAIVGQGTIFDGLAYWAIIVGVYLMVGGLMFYSGKEKLFDENGHPPLPVVKQFQNSFVSHFPG